MINGSNCLKKSKTIEQRIKGLEKRNLVIDNKKLLTEYIEKNNTYYHLTGYRFLLERYNETLDDYHLHNSSELIALS